MLEDNIGCIALATNPMTTGKTKQIAIKHHSIRELVKSKTVKVQYYPT